MANEAYILRVRKDEHSPWENIPAIVGPPGPKGDPGGVTTTGTPSPGQFAVFDTNNSIKGVTLPNLDTEAR